MIRTVTMALIGLVALASLARAEAGWPHYGGDAGGTRHSDAAEITPGNVGELQRAWTYRTGDMKTRADDMKYSAFEGTPILVAGALIFCTPFNEVIALDPGTGAQKWRYDPKIEGGYRPANQFVCRGVTHWADAAAGEGDLCASRLFMGTTDGRLIALDAPTGQPCLGFGMDGQVNIDPGMPLLTRSEFQITSPPAIARGVVVIGSAMGDNQRADAPRGTVRAYDARTGKPLWNFNPVARGAEDFPDDWQDGSAERTGHANAWAPMSADEARGLIFVPTSSPSPDFFGGERVGDNAYANSVVALDATSGEVRWHFQTVHHDVWDYDLPAQPSLVTLQRDGRPLDVVVQVTKTGLVFVLDRDTGKPVFEVEERPVPQGGVLGEVLSPTQPFPVAPPPLVPHKLSADDVWGLTFVDRNICRDMIAAARSEGIFTPPSEQGTILFPFTGGGANWGGMAFDPASQTMYINTSRAAHIVTLIPRDKFAAAKAAEPNKEISPQAGTAWGMKRDILLSPIDLPCNKPPFGMLHAIDLNDGTIKWESVLGTVRDLAPVPLPWKTGTPNFGGPVVTAGGLVFIGAAMDNYLRAFDAKTGEEVWKGRLPAGGQATPMTYEWEGRQYVVIAAGGHSTSTTTRGDFVVAYALPE